MRKFYCVLILLLGLTGLLQAQNRPYIDDRPFNFGFLLGTNLMDFAAPPSLLELDGTIYQTRVSSLVPGFSVGVIGNMRLNRYLSLRCTPTLHFGQRTISYKPETATDNTSVQTTDVISLPITLPFYIKFSAEREVNYRPYLIAGGGVYFDLGRDKERSVLLKPFDYFVEVGLGCDFYFSFFKLAPELKFAVGFNNLLTPVDARPELAVQDEFYTRALSRLNSRMLTLVFNFE